MSCSPLWPPDAIGELADVGASILHADASDVQGDVAEAVEGANPGAGGDSFTVFEPFCKRTSILVHKSWNYR